MDAYHRISWILPVEALSDEVIESMRGCATRAEARQLILKPKTPSDRWNGLREFYRLALPEISAVPPWTWGIDPYEVDWLRVFTPIEYGTWQDIRATGAVLYPQFPIGRYFVDFANPVAKVAVECDGRMYHTDKAKDAARQREIEAIGWKVYRQEGWECLLPDEIKDEESGAWVPTTHPARNLIPFIARVHGISLRYLNCDE